MVETPESKKKLQGLRYEEDQYNRYFIEMEKFPKELKIQWVISKGSILVDASQAQQPNPKIIASNAVSNQV